MTEQQIRNCTIRLLDSKFNEFVVEMAEAKSFKATTSFLTTEQRKGWYDQELVLRFFAFKNDLASYVHEIGDFLTEYMERVSDKASDKHLVFEYENEQEIFEKTFDIFEASLGERAFSRVNTKGTDLVEAFGIYHYELTCPPSTVPVIFPKSPSTWRMMDMRASKFSEEQIIGFLRQAEAGMPIKEIGRKHGFSDASFYKWRSKYAGMDASEAKRLRELELENNKLKRLLAEAHLDIHALKSVFGTKR